MIWPAINKIEKEAEKALMIVPVWPTQIWTLELATETPIIIESTPPSARHQQTIPALPEAETDDHMLLQEQT